MVACSRVKLDCAQGPLTFVSTVPDSYWSQRAFIVGSAERRVPRGGNASSNSGLRLREELVSAQGPSHSRARQEETSTNHTVSDVTGSTMSFVVCPTGEAQAALYRTSCVATGGQLLAQGHKVRQCLPPPSLPLPIPSSHLREHPTQEKTSIHCQPRVLPGVPVGIASRKKVCSDLVVNRCHQATADPFSSGSAAEQPACKREEEWRPLLTRNRSSGPRGVDSVWALGWRADQRRNKRCQRPRVQRTRIHQACRHRWGLLKT